MAAPRAPFACDPEASRGRLFAEPPSRTRSPFRRDCDRVIHSTAFRRLKHKTQVFVFHEGDHYRTRMTHSLEVAQIARALARQLGLDEDLTEALALAHDLGHPPFGHAGERALDARLKAHGGFDHNAQSLRVVTSLEHRYPEFDGLNLTWESLEGIAKHYPDLDENRRGAELVRELISYLIGAVVSEARKRLQAAQPKSVENVRSHGGVLIALPPEVAQAEAGIKSFLTQRMYRHPRVMAVMNDAEQILSDLFARYQEM